MTQRTIGISLLLSVALIAGGIRASHADVANTAYLQTVEQWRKGYEASLRSDDGWLTVAGLYWLHEGDNTFGSDPLNDIVVPSEEMPAKAGVFEFQNGKTIVHVNRGSKITMNGKPVESAELLPDAPMDVLRLGDLTLFLHASGTRYAIRLKDKNSKFRREFTGLNWFPVDESYRISGRYTPYDPPRQKLVQSMVGDFDKVSIVGYVTFTLHGVEYRLDAEVNQPNELWFVFRDLTSGKETYGAARFLETEVPKNGTVIMDFNEAYNPPCAYNPYTTCPLPTPENRLRVAIPSGEKIYQHH
jgi:uncharacterized protein (DUF1684 family)